MKYNLFNFILSFGKIKGKNNKVTAEIKGKNYPLFTFFSRFGIKGSNNKVIFKYDKFNLKYLFLPFGLKLKILGDNNNFEIISPPKIVGSEAYMIGDNVNISIDRTEQRISDAKFYVTNGCSLKIGKYAQMKNGGLKIVIVDSYKNKANVTIGDNFLAAQNLLIRAGDGHTLIDIATNEAVNEPQSITIGNNVWIGANSTILKGVELPDNTIVGACSLVTKKFKESNTVIAGHPAKVIKRGYKWDRLGYALYMERKENEVEK